MTALDQSITDRSDSWVTTYSTGASFSEGSPRALRPGPRRQARSRLTVQHSDAMGSRLRSPQVGGALSCEDQEQTSRSVHVWSTEHWPSGCKPWARPCSRSTGAAQLVCRCPPRTAVARIRCCTSLLYGTTGASKNTVKFVLTSDYQLGNWLVMLSLTRVPQVNGHF